MILQSRPRKVGHEELGNELTCSILDGIPCKQVLRANAVSDQVTSSDLGILSISTHRQSVVVLKASSALVHELLLFDLFAAIFKLLEDFQDKFVPSR